MEISKRRFRRWLGTQGYHSDVGRPKDPQTCPIATFVNDYYQVEDTFVSLDSISYTKGLTEYERVTPPWAKTFITHVDRCRKSITAKTALNILEKI